MAFVFFRFLNSFFLTGTEIIIQHSRNPFKHFRVKGLISFRLIKFSKQIVSFLKHNFIDLIVFLQKKTETNAKLNIVANSFLAVQEYRCTR